MFICSGFMLLVYSESKYLSRILIKKQLGRLNAEMEKAFLFNSTFVGLFVTFLIFGGVSLISKVLFFLNLINLCYRYLYRKKEVDLSKKNLSDM